jgi:signal transduction histidine kinase
LVTVPVVLIVVYQQQVMTSALITLQQHKHDDLQIRRDLVTIQQIARKVPALALSLEPRGSGNVVQQELHATQALLMECAQRDPLWMPLSLEWSALQRSHKSGDLNLFSEQRHIVISEIDSLTDSLLQKETLQLTPIAHELARTKRVTGWSLVLVLGLGGILAWLLVGRHSAQLVALRRKVNAFAEGEAVSSRSLLGGDEEVAGVTRAFNVLQKKIEHSMVHREYFESLLDSMSESVVVSDLTGRVAYANAAAQKLWDADHRGLLGRYAADLMPFQWIPADLDGGAWFDGPLHQFDEQSAQVFGRRTHISNPSGGLEGTVYVVQDVTQSKELMRANLNYRDQLARSEQLASFGTLGAIVAHKFNQPLSAVRLFLQQIQRELKDKEVSALVHGNLGESLSELGRIAELTKQMLAGGRQRARSESSQSSAQVTSAVERVVESLQHSAAHRDVTLHILCSDHRIRAACADFELEEMLYCLINNSIQAAPDDRPTQVTITAVQEGSFVKLVVCDTGRGISPEHLDRIFDWCFTTKAEGQGTGLGLAIVRSIVELHGGQISVVSEQSVGSRFSIALPLAEEQQVYDRNTERFYC